MPNQIVLAWTVNVAGTSLGPAGAAARLAAVPLYTSPVADPVLGQAFGLTVANDVTAPGAGNATRTLTLNMTSVPGPPTAPPPFPCSGHPSTTGAVPIATVTALEGEFVVVNGSAVVRTLDNQVAALQGRNILIEFASQLGTFYGISAFGPASITLAGPYNGPSANTSAVKIVQTPTPNVAVYSTSPLDTNGTGATTPAIPAGSGARTLSITYLDSTGAGPFTITVPLTGRRPSPLVLGGGIDFAVFVDMHIATVGGFKNSVGQITLATLASPLPPLPATPTPDEFLGPLTDQAQLLLGKPVLYLPPSYFALTQQGAATPQLAGDFIVTTGSTQVPTTVDQTAALAAGNTIRFASQPPTTTPFGAVDETYVLADVTPRSVTLARPYTGLDRNKLDSYNPPRPTNQTANAQMQPTGAFLVAPSPAAPPANAQLASAVGEFVNPGNAVPPPNPPLAPSVMAPTPTVLSGLFTKTIQLALAVPVTAAAVTFI